VPAAAVIPAPIAYIKVVAVKKLVVGFLGRSSSAADWRLEAPSHPSVNASRHSFAGGGLRYFTLRKLECFRQARPEYISME
jgi:cobalamin biosynthesis protein CobD/CbiB